MPPIRVVASSREQGELWSGDELLAVTFLYDGRLHVRIEVRADGKPWLIDATSLGLALDEAARRLED
jgi:hypothetical protein